MCCILIEIQQPQLSGCNRMCGPVSQAEENICFKKKIALCLSKYVANTQSLQLFTLITGTYCDVIPGPLRSGRETSAPGQRGTSAPVLELPLVRTGSLNVVAGIWRNTSVRLEHHLYQNSQNLVTQRNRKKYIEKSIRKNYKKILNFANLIKIKKLEHSFIKFFYYAN